MPLSSASAEASMASVRKTGSDPNAVAMTRSTEPVQRQSSKRSFSTTVASSLSLDGAISSVGDGGGRGGGKDGTDGKDGMDGMGPRPVSERCPATGGGEGNGVGGGGGGGGGGNGCDAATRRRGSSSSPLPSPSPSLSPSLSPSPSPGASKIGGRSGRAQDGDRGGDDGDGDGEEAETGKRRGQDLGRPSSPSLSQRQRQPQQQQQQQQHRTSGIGPGIYKRPFGHRPVQMRGSSTSSGMSQFRQSLVNRRASGLRRSSLFSAADSVAKEAAAAAAAALDAADADSDVDVDVDVDVGTYATDADADAKHQHQHQHQHQRGGPIPQKQEAPDIGVEFGMRDSYVLAPVRGQGGDPDRESISVSRNSIVRIFEAAEIFGGGSNRNLAIVKNSAAAAAAAAVAAETVASDDDDDDDDDVKGDDNDDDADDDNNHKDDDDDDDDGIPRFSDDDHDHDQQGDDDGVVVKRNSAHDAQLVIDEINQKHNSKSTLTAETGNNDDANDNGNKQNIVNENDDHDHDHDVTIVDLRRHLRNRRGGMGSLHLASHGNRTTLDHIPPRLSAIESLVQTRKSAVMMEEMLSELKFDEGDEDNLDLDEDDHENHINNNDNGKNNGTNNYEQDDDGEDAGESLRECSINFEPTPLPEKHPPPSSTSSSSSYRRHYHQTHRPPLKLSGNVENGLSVDENTVGENPRAQYRHRHYQHHPHHANAPLVAFNRDSTTSITPEEATAAAMAAAAAFGYRGGRNSGSISVGDRDSAFALSALCGAVAADPPVRSTSAPIGSTSTSMSMSSGGPNPGLLVGAIPTIPEAVSTSTFPHSFESTAPVAASASAPPAIMTPPLLPPLLPGGGIVAGSSSSLSSSSSSAVAAAAALMGIGVGMGGGAGAPLPPLLSSSSSSVSPNRGFDLRGPIPLALRMPPVPPAHNLLLRSSRRYGGGDGGDGDGEMSSIGAGGMMTLMMPNSASASATNNENNDDEMAERIYRDLPSIEDGMCALAEHVLKSTLTYMNEHFPSAELSIQDLLPSPDGWELLSNQLQGSATIPECLRRVGYGYAYKRRCTIMLSPGSTGTNPWYENVTAMAHFSLKFASNCPIVLTKTAGGYSDGHGDDMVLYSVVCEYRCHVPHQSAVHMTNAREIAAMTSFASGPATKAANAGFIARQSDPANVSAMSEELDEGSALGGLLDSPILSSFVTDLRRANLRYRLEVLSGVTGNTYSFGRGTELPGSAAWDTTAEGGGGGGGVGNGGKGGAARESSSSLRSSARSSSSGGGGGGGGGGGSLAGFRRESDRSAGIGGVGVGAAATTMGLQSCPAVILTPGDTVGIGGQGSVAGGTSEGNPRASADYYGPGRGVTRVALSLIEGHYADLARSDDGGAGAGAGDGLPRPSLPSSPSFSGPCGREGRETLLPHCLLARHCRVLDPTAFRDAFRAVAVARGVPSKHEVLLDPSDAGKIYVGGRFVTLWGQDRTLCSRSPALFGYDLNANDIELERDCRGRYRVLDFDVFKKECSRVLQEVLIDASQIEKDFGGRLLNRLLSGRDRSQDTAGKSEIAMDVSVPCLESEVMSSSVFDPVGISAKALATRFARQFGREGFPCLACDVPYVKSRIGPHRVPVPAPQRLIDVLRRGGYFDTKRTEEDMWFNGIDSGMYYSASQAKDPILATQTLTAAIGFIKHAQSMSPDVHRKGPVITSDIVVFVRKECLTGMVQTLFSNDFVCRYNEKNGKFYVNDIIFSMPLTYSTECLGINGNDKEVAILKRGRLLGMYLVQRHPDPELIISYAINGE